MFNLSSNFREEPEGKQRKEWRLFHAKDFQSLMHPCFTMCRILGIFPYKINAPTFKVSKRYYILSIIVICFCSIHTLIWLYGVSSFGQINLAILPKTIASYCVIVLGDFTIAVTFILTGPRIRLLQTILKISSRLPSESYEKLSRLIHAKDIIGFLLVGLMLIFASLLEIDLFQIYVGLVIFQMDMMYVNCICVLKACFKAINDNLANMREFTVNKPHVPRPLIYYKQRNPFLIMELKALKKQHLTISNTVHMLNMIFSLHLLATIVMTFFEITLRLYCYISTWQYFWPKSTLVKVLFNVYFPSRIVYLFMKIILIVWACETGKDQAVQISTSIHDVFNSINDEQIKDELQLFSLQILHCDNIFSAKGLTVNAKFLTGIMGSIVTYVLILFQFKSTEFCRKTILWK